MMIFKLCFLLLLLEPSTCSYFDNDNDKYGDIYKKEAEPKLYDVYSGKPIDKKKEDAFNKAGVADLCTVKIEPCNKHEPPRVDGTCNNIHNPTRGASFTPLKRLLPSHYGPGNSLRKAKDGSELPLVRQVRTTLFPDGLGVKFHDLTNLFTHFFVHVTVDVTSLIDIALYALVIRNCCEIREANPLCLPIDVPDSDPYLRQTDIKCMNFTRTISFQDLGCLTNSVPRERANLATPLVDLSTVYGYSQRASNRTRQFKDGLLKEVERNGAKFPPGNSPLCFNNQLPAETQCYEYGAPIEGNVLLGTNLITLWHYRQHNHIARELAKMNPCWSDEKLFNTARRINIALYQQIYYYEMLPIILGYEYAEKNTIIFDTEGHVNDYDPHLEPTISYEAIIGLRWFHNLQDSRTNLYNPHSGKFIDTISQVDNEFRSGALENNKTLERLSQGFRQPVTKIDETFDRDLGERLLGNLHRASDLISIDIMRSRDAGLQAYNAYRKICGLPEAKQFKDFEDVISKDKVELLSLLYNEPDDVDYMVGIYAERVIPGSYVGWTLRCIAGIQYQHFRRSDRFWFEHDKVPGSFTRKQLREIRKATLASLTCGFGDKVKEIQPHAMYYPSKKNPIMPCRHIVKPKIVAWKDDKCYYKYASDKIGNDKNHLDDSYYMEPQTKYSYQLKAPGQSAENSYSVKETTPEMVTESPKQDFRREESKKNENADASPKKDSTVKVSPKTDFTMEKSPTKDSNTKESTKKNLTVEGLPNKDSNIDESAKKGTNGGEIPKEDPSMEESPNKDSVKGKSPKIEPEIANQKQSMIDFDKIFPDTQPPNDAYAYIKRLYESIEYWKSLPIKTQNDREEDSAETESSNKGSDNKKTNDDKLSKSPKTNYYDLEKANIPYMRTPYYIYQKRKNFNRYPYTDSDYKQDYEEEDSDKNDDKSVEKAPPSETPKKQPNVSKPSKIDPAKPEYPKQDPPSESTKNDSSKDKLEMKSNDLYSILSEWYSDFL